MSQLSFQPWPLEKPQSPNVIEVLQRVQIERGQLFRNVTEASLQEEIAADGDLSPNQSLSEDEEEDSNDNEKELSKQTKSGQPVSREELQRAKFDMFQQVGIAHNEIMMALDFISLLESEHAAQAQHTMSQALKDAVPSKTIGTDIWEHMPVDEARLEQDRLLARNVKMRSLQQSAEDILGAAKRLEDNVRKETQFWDQMLSISSKGWSICRLPKKGLGVRYGFSESSAEFSKRDIAALNHNEDGSVSLDRGFGTKPTGLKVTVFRNGQVAGRSSLPSKSDDSETTLEARIRHARDSIFDEELFREMTRESRTMAALGVVVRGHTITVPAATLEESDSTEIHIELAPLDDETEFQNSPANPDDATAQAIALGARLILSQAHREKLDKRSEVPEPMAGRNEEKPVMSILKPLASFLLHKSSLRVVNTYLDQAISALSRAGIDVTPSCAALEFPENKQITNTAELVSMLKSTMVSTASLRIKTPSRTVDITINVESSLAQTQNPSSMFNLTGSDEQSQRFDAVEDLVQSADAAIASALAAALGSTADGNWVQDQREALLVLDDEGQDERRSVWVAMDSQKGRLALASLQKELVWQEGEKLPGFGMWEGWSKIV